MTQDIEIGAATRVVLAPPEAIEAAHDPPMATAGSLARYKPRLPASLWRYIDTKNSKWIVPKMAWTPGLRLRIERAKVALERGMAPADAVFIGRMMGRLSVAMGLRAEDADDWGERVAEYLRMLSEYPQDIWAAAVEEIILTVVWFPKISELAAIMRPELAKRSLALERVKAMLLEDSGGAAQRLEAPANGIWRQYDSELRQAVGESAWASWFRQIIPESDDGDTLNLAVPTRFWADHVRAMYGDTIREVIGRAQVVIVQRAWCAAAIDRHNRQRTAE